MNSRAWKRALVSASLALSVSGCVGWGGYPHAKNVHESQLIGTWRAQKCHTTLTLSAAGSASATGIPTEMELDGKVTQKVGGDGTWEIDESGDTQQLDVTIENQGTSFDLYRDKGRLLVGLTVGDPDDANWCVLTRQSATHPDRQGRADAQAA
uniref:Lipoprotein n=1 Tax=Streptomyces sp. NBC_01393 TaxID=2903851 RepID=A0AAU3I938_9ACTN